MPPIAQLAEAADLKSVQCRFESDWGDFLLRFSCPFSKTEEAGRQSAVALLPESICRQNNMSALLYQRGSLGHDSG